jgi:hypothetical protein
MFLFMVLFDLEYVGYGLFLRFGGLDMLYSIFSDLRVLAVFDVWEKIELLVGFVCVSFGGFCGWIG